MADTYTKLLLHCDGADAATAFLDSSTDHKTVTVNGNAQIDTAQKKFDSASALFDGNGDYLSLADSDDWDFGTGDFTIDLWMRFNTITADNQFMDIGSGISGTTKGITFIYNNGASTWDIYINGAGVFAVASEVPNAGTWYHIALVRVSGQLKFFKDGVQKGADVANSADITGSTEGLSIGKIIGNTAMFNGWLDEVRISKGIARWTANFTPPTSAYIGEELDQSYLLADGADSIGNAGGQDWQSMSFIPTQTGKLTRLKLDFKYAVAAATGTLYCYLYSDDGTGKPSALLSTLSTLDSSTVGVGYATYDFTIAYASAYTITASTRYHIVIKFTAGNPSNYLHTHIKRVTGTEAVCYSAAGSSWTKVPADPYYYMNFKQYYDATPVTNTRGFAGYLEV